MEYDRRRSCPNPIEMRSPLRLRRLPIKFLLALINATAILVIVAAILALVAMVRIDNFAGRVVTTN